MSDHDVLILGGGSGLTAAYHAEADGLDVAVVEPGPLGGTCVNRGCIPTKTLIESADLAREVQRSAAFDVDAGDPDVDVSALLARMREMRAANVSHSDDWLENSEQITLYREKARFVDDRTVELSDSGEKLAASHVFVATGARPLIPPIDGIDDVDVLTNRTILDDLEDAPDSLTIVGGGYIGLEFGHFFSAVGTDVTIVEGGDRLAEPEDSEIGHRLTDAVSAYTDVHLTTYATRLTEKSDQVVVEGEDRADGSTIEVSADEVLVATGRRPNTGELNLAATGVETTDRGWIDVDETFQTTNPFVYAYGDVIGRGMFKHTSSFEGEAAYRNSQGGHVTVDYDANPHAIFTEPKVAGVGMTEDEAQQAARDVEVAKAGYPTVAKGNIVQAEDGFAKAVVDPTTREILGFHAIGPQAPTLVHEVVVAMTAGDGSIDNITDAIHVHPTLSELVHTLFTRF
jgi:dihydrolipoamide dehydrogenase